jgi:hypothetical protein
MTRNKVSNRWRQTTDPDCRIGSDRMCKLMENKMVCHGSGPLQRSPPHFSQLTRHPGSRNLSVVGPNPKQFHKRVGQLTSLKPLTSKNSFTLRPRLLIRKACLSPSGHGGHRSILDVVANRNIPKIPSENSSPKVPVYSLPTCYSAWLNCVLEDEMRDFKKQSDWLDDYKWLPDWFLCLVTRSMIGIWFNNLLTEWISDKIIV